MESRNPSDPVRPTNAPDENRPTNAPNRDNPTNAPQTRGQNPDNSHRGAMQGDANTTTPDDATNRGGYAGSRQGEYDNRDGAPRPEGGGQSDPYPSNVTADPGGTSGYTNASARQGATEQGVGSRGGSYNDEYSNSPKAAEAGRQASEQGASAGAASGLVNTGPDQQRAESDARQRMSDPGIDSAGASAGRSPDTSENL